MILHLDCFLELLIVLYCIWFVIQIRVSKKAFVEVNFSRFSTVGLIFLYKVFSFQLSALYATIVLMSQISIIDQHVQKTWPSWHTNLNKPSRVINLGECCPYLTLPGLLQAQSIDESRLKWKWVMINLVIQELQEIARNRRSYTLSVPAL